MTQLQMVPTIRTKLLSDEVDEGDVIIPEDGKINFRRFNVSKAIAEAILTKIDEAEAKLEGKERVRRRSKLTNDLLELTKRLNDNELRKLLIECQKLYK